MAASLSVAEVRERQPGAPEWTEPSLHVTPGRDPLGLQTITLDRIMPRLLPGILVLSQRARYFSLHAFLLSEYQRLRLPLSNNDLSLFVKLREFEYAVAVQLCPRGCGGVPSGVVGKLRAGPAAQSGGALIARQESVESPLGGYGLYYRSPMIDLGLVVPRGSTLDETVTPVDVLDPRGLGADLADTFREAIADTAYVREHMLANDPVPVEVLTEFAEHACLCRLPDFPKEQALLRRVLFEVPAPAYTDPTAQRCRSFALFLRELEREPAVASSNGAFMQAIWDDFLAEPAGQTLARQTIAQWAALSAKDWWQESLCSIWSHFLRVSGEHPDGLDVVELDVVMRSGLLPPGRLDALGRELELDSAESTEGFARRVTEATSDLPLDDLRRWAVETDTAGAGLVLLLALLGRLPEQAKSSSGWIEIGLQSSERQPSFLEFVRLLEAHLEDSPTLGETLAWLIRRFVVNAHEQIAYSKLPEFTFRFRWEGGRLRFYTLGLGRFDLADIRRQSMSRISGDVGLWSQVDEGPSLTDEGVAFIRSAFPE